MTINFQVLCFGLVVAGMVLSIVLNIVFGGFTVGKLTRRFEVVVTPDRLDAFLARMHQRLAELGFQTEAPWVYVQRGQQFGVPTSHTHAKSHKRLEVTADQANPQQTRVGMAVHFLSPILGDTGESAYGDAVMKYISGEAAAMQPVANRSFMAFSSLVLSIWACVAMLAMKVLHLEPFTRAALTLTITPLLTSIFAIVTILLKPKELRGLWLAITGLVISVLALVAVALLAFVKAVA